VTSRPSARRDEIALALLGAFPFPLPQGSQIFMADQARALARAGARPTLFTYGRGQGAPPPDLDVAAAPAWTTPRAMRSGPNAGKPLADSALLATWTRAASRQRFAFALAHNVEAAWIGLLARARTRVPVVYVAHTLLRHELSAYAHPRWRRVLDRTGARIDHFVARHADAVLALCEEAADELAPHARGPVAVIPPGHDPAGPPSSAAIDRVCAHHDLRPHAFFLYTGNLDGYQELELLAAAAGRLPAGAPPVAVATHDAPAAAAAARRLSPLRIVSVSAWDEMRALIHAARALVLTRRRPGGFPVKLLNYMEAARPIVAFEQVAVGLRDGESARLLDAAAGAADLASALTGLDREPAAAERLGAAAHRHLLDHHGWEAIAQRTLELLAKLRD